MKTDLRVQLTKKMIRETFLDLLKEKPLSKITVKEICEKAQINRGTFYKHYYDTYDLMEQLEDEAIDNFEQLLCSDLTDKSMDLLVIILNTLQNYRELFRTLNGTTGKTAFTAKLTNRCMKYIFPLHSDSLSPDSSVSAHSENSLEFHYLAGGTSYIIELYLSGKIDGSPEELARQLDTLNKRIIG